MRDKKIVKSGFSLLTQNIFGDINNRIGYITNTIGNK